MAQKKNGEIIPVHLSLAEQQISPTRRYFTGIMRNVEEELEMKKSVLQQEREILDTLLVPSLMIDEAGMASREQFLVNVRPAHPCTHNRQDTRLQQGMLGSFRLHPAGGDRS